MRGFGEKSMIHDAEMLNELSGTGEAERGFDETSASQLD